MNNSAWDELHSRHQSDLTHLTKKNRGGSATRSMLEHLETGAQLPSERLAITPSTVGDRRHDNGVSTRFSAEAAWRRAIKDDPCWPESSQRWHTWQCDLERLLGCVKQDALDDSDTAVGSILSARFRQLLQVDSQNLGTDTLLALAVGLLFTLTVDDDGSREIESGASERHRQGPAAVQT